MDVAAYHSMRDLQDEHWWFVGRRQFLRKLIERHGKLGQDARIFEAGCGFGGNLPLLEEFGTVAAFEYSDEARTYCAARSGIAVMPGALPDGVDFGGRTYDLVALLDVLEHIDDDRGSLETLGQGLAEGGRMVITVPAFQWLWSKHDELHHHKRRYSRKSLERVIRAAGLRPLKTGYFNSLLFPLAVIQRMATRIAGGEAVADELPPKPLNRALGGIFSLESAMAGKVGLPFGLSAYAIVDKPGR